MSNYLFQNIANVFAAPAAVTEIVAKLTPVKKDGFDTKENAKASMEHVPTNERGEIAIPNEVVIGKSADIFGDKIYETLSETIAPALDDLNAEDEPDEVIKSVRAVGKALKDTVEQDVITPAFDQYGLKKGKKKQLVRDATTRIDYAVTRLEGDYQQQVRIADNAYKQKLAEAETSAQIEAAEAEHKQSLNDALAALNNSVKDLAGETMKTQPEETTKKLETFKVQEEKQSVEDKVRAHLRGLSRTIPSFIMAYGDENLTLANFDDYTEDDVFEEVTGISEEDFRFLRDGGDYEDEQTGKMEHFNGGLFDEVVFNDSIREFLNKRDELADYFKEGKTEDIFDYIPPQKTNQIFMPRWVVKKMVEELETENPGCYEDPDATFADLYMKSGLYITEIVKKLFNSDGLKKAFPDEQERIQHILGKQVYGMAPTRIIYLIAMNYIFGFDDKLRERTRFEELPNFAEADAAAAAKAGTLKQLVDETFGDDAPETVETATGRVSDRRNEVSSTQKTASEEADWIIEKLIGADLEYVDKRQNDGALWVLGGGGLADFMSELEQEGAVFGFKAEGAKALDGSAGWWIKGYPERKNA